MARVYIETCVPVGYVISIAIALTALVVLATQIGGSY